MELIECDRNHDESKSLSYDEVRHRRSPSSPSPQLLQQMVVGEPDGEVDSLLLLAEEQAKPSQASSSFLSPVIWSILVTETAERFAYYGFRAILVLYFVEQLQYTDRQAIALFAYVSSLAYFSPLVGAVLADGSLGRYRTILYFGMIYLLGLVVLTGGAALSEGPSSAHFRTLRILSFTGLFLVCMGTGG
jgi:dipeptide/tripeptide permease